jgi:hypothetical protein
VAAAAHPAAREAHRDAGELPVAGARRLHRAVVDDDLLPGLQDVHPPVEKVLHHERLLRAALEAAQRHRAARQHHLRRVERAHPQDRHEDPAALNVDDEAEDARRLARQAQHRDDVAYAADLVAVRVEHDEAGEARAEHAGRGGRHAREATAACP